MPAARKAAATKRSTTRKTAAKKPASKTAARRKSASKPPGRPPLLQVDPDLQGKIVEYVKCGAFPERAAIACGVSERTHYAWMSRGRDELARREADEKPNDNEQMYVDYAQAIERGVAEAEMMLMETALKGGPAGTASMNILERRFRERWGAKATVAGGAPASGSTSVPATPLDQLNQRRQERAAREQAAR